MSTKKATNQPSLRELLAHLMQRARETGADQRLTLARGLQLVVRVQAGTITLTCSRPKTRVGDQELVIVRAAAGVPPTAERIPGDVALQGTRALDGATHWYVAYRWKDA